ncbi:MAG TPA: radical SAM protein [Candidatus Aminicenantes bacterium]|mgnify:CR=1 FL=1|nr:radical SAM protein [Candidatus Aminicenantes bacterium]
MKEKIKKIEAALSALSGHETSCSLCPRGCRVDRRKEKLGVCQTGCRARVSHGLLHFGEEPVLSGSKDLSPDPGKDNGRRRGSGTVFFAGCNLKCLFCQNYQLSWFNEGRIAADEDLARMMLGLQSQGALNINLVSPTHVILPILRALRIAIEWGLNLPIVYNSNGYDSLEAIARLEGIVDIYLPDLKYFSSGISGRYSGAPDYFGCASAAVREMTRQQPRLIVDGHEVAERGVIVRHLVMPGHADDSLAVLDWMLENLPATIGLSLMSQYHPCHRAPEEIRRPLTRDEYRKVAEKASELDVESLFIQPEPFGPDEHLVPDFRRKNPFRWK